MVYWIYSSALGSSSATSSSPPVVGERRLFSSVTKLGFAAGHDSPSLKLDGSNSLNGNGAGSSLETGGNFSKSDFAGCFSKSYTDAENG